MENLLPCKPGPRTMFSFQLQGRAYSQNTFEINLDISLSKNHPPERKSWEKRSLRANPVEYEEILLNLLDV